MRFITKREFRKKQIPKKTKLFFMSDTKNFKNFQTDIKVGIGKQIACNGTYHFFNGKYELFITLFRQPALFKALFNLLFLSKSVSEKNIQILVNVSKKPEINDEIFNCPFQLIYLI